MYGIVMHPYPQAHARKVAFLSAGEFRVRHICKNKGNARTRTHLVQIASCSKVQHFESLRR